MYLKYKKSTEVEKNQIVYIFLGLLLTTIVALPLNLILPQFIFIPLEIARLGIYSFLFFYIFTAFAIAKYHLFGVKVILTEILVGAMGILLFVNIFISKTIFDYVWKGITFSLFLICACYLLKAVYVGRKVERKR